MSGLNAGAAEWRPGAPSAQLGGAIPPAKQQEEVSASSGVGEDTSVAPAEETSSKATLPPPGAFNLGAKPFVPGTLGTPTSTPQTFSAYTGRTEPPRVLNAAQQKYQQGNQQPRQQYPGGDQQQGQQQYNSGLRQPQQQQQTPYNNQQQGSFNQQHQQQQYGNQSGGYQQQGQQGSYGGNYSNNHQQQQQQYGSSGGNQQQNQQFNNNNNNQQQGGFNSQPQGYSTQQGGYPQQQQQQQRQMQPPQMRQMRPPPGGQGQQQQQGAYPQQSGQYNAQQQQPQQQHYSQNPYQQQAVAQPQTQTPPPQQQASGVREMRPPMRQMKPPGGSATSTPTAPGPAGSLTKPTTGAVPLTTRAADSVPPVILMIGVRGSGKSTQAKKIAEAFNFLHFSSGDIARQGKDPLAELDAALGTWLTAEGNFKENGSQAAGLVLDRYVAISHFDVYYLGHILQKYSLRINLVINLNLDPELGNDRAKARDEGRDTTVSSTAGDLKSRPQRDQRRLVEQNLLSETCRLLFQASGALEQVVVTERGVEDVANECMQLVHKAISQHPRNVVQLSRCTLEDGSPLVTDFAVFKEVRNGLHEVLGTPKMKWEAFPGSQMTGQMTQDEWKKWEHSSLRDYFVTLKADGKRVLLVRWEDRIFIMPSKFVCMYELQQKYIPSVLSGTTREEAKDGKRPTEGPESKLRFILDCEFVQQRSNEKFCFYIFDYIFFEGKKAIKVYFADRYKLLKDLMEQQTAYSCVFLKEFVDLCDVKKILPGKFHDESLPFEIDGLILQHNGPYRVPQDPKVYKWKPRELCSVDFRLCNMSVLPPSEEDTDCTYRFELATLAVVDGVKDERPYQGGRAVLLATEVDVRQNSLANGTVIEAVKAKWNNKQQQQQDSTSIQEWRFMRVRTDKAFPNAEEIAVAIDNMKPWQLDDLRKAAAQLQPPRGR